jgi:hypothetical protein
MDSDSIIAHVREWLVASKLTWTATPNGVRLAYQDPTSTIGSYTLCITSTPGLLKCVATSDARVPDANRPKAALAIAAVNSTRDGDACAELCLEVKRRAKCPKQVGVKRPASNAQLHCIWPTADRRVAPASVVPRPRSLASARAWPSTGGDKTAPGHSLLFKARLGMRRLMCSSVCAPCRSPSTPHRCTQPSLKRRERYDMTRLL